MICFPWQTWCKIILTEASGNISTFVFSVHSNAAFTPNAICVAMTASSNANSMAQT